MVRLQHNQNLQILNLDKKNINNLIGLSGITGARLEHGEIN